ncbi:TonB-dependent siderophore receptor [Stanieria cyanosphaera]|uniref:TonB-dependent siderophore receptor n=1 Tax=Stanieria cyanosphaera TaxID=102116 RepID=UPI001FE1C847|nr:TonB-dependent siderophore receptor [Stanieria cyanosphaera]
MKQSLGLSAIASIKAIAMGFSLIAIVPLSIESVSAEEVAKNPISSQNNQASRQLLEKTKQRNNNKSLEPIFLNAKDLLVQRQNQGIARVTDVQINQTENGLELILETPSRQQLVPLILPEGKDLVIDILDATLGFSLRNGFKQANPAPGISQITVTKVNETSIQVRITGTQQVPSAEVISNQDNLVLGVTPDGTTVQQTPDEAMQRGHGGNLHERLHQEEIEIIATGEVQEDDDYFVPDAGVTRTDTPIIDTPGTIQVIPRQVIEDQRAIELRDALSRNAVGVVTNSAPSSNFNNVLIRGFNVSSNFLRNGIPESFFTLTPPRDLNNIERLEVLSGPASVIGGQISPGGIVNLATKQPLSSPFYELSASYGSFNSVEGAFDFSGPLNDSKTVAYRLNTSIYHSDTSIDVDEVDIERFSIAPVLNWQIGEQTKISFEGLYLNSRTPQRIGLPAQGTVLDNPNGEIPRDQFVGEPNFDGNDRKITQLGYDLEHSLSDDWSLRHAFRYTNFQSKQREAFVNAIQDDLRTLERSGDSFIDDINNYQTTAYLTGKFKTGEINHELLAGIDYVFEEDYFESEFFEAENIDLFEPVYTGGVGAAFEDSLGRFRDTNQGVGIYLQDQIKFFDDRLIVVLGGRVDFVSSSSQDLRDQTSEEASQDDTAFSPRVGIVYKLADNISLYGSFSRSFEQVTGVTATNEIFEPSRGTQYEIGVKANWLDNRLFTTLAFYDLTLSNLTTSDPNNPQFDIQTGEQNSQGIELQTGGEILPGWNIIANYAYTDAKITQDNIFTVGNSLANVPENALSLWSTYTIPEGNLSGLGFGFGLLYVGQREGDLDNSFQLEDYLRTDAAIYYRREQLKLALNFQNLFDVDYIEVSDDDLRVYPGDPFTVLFSASYEF